MCGCILALVIRHSKRMRPIILISVACLALPYFSTLSHTRVDFREKVIEHDMCVLIHYTSFVCYISPSKKIRRDAIIHVHTYVVI